MLSLSYAVREFVLFIVQKVILFYVYVSNTVGFFSTRELIRLLTT